MTDVLTKQQRSYCMSRIRGKNTRPETVLRKKLWHLGYRYRLASGLPGKPDIVLPRHRIAIFVDGCFWHRCPAHFTPPRANREFWQRKMDKNVARDDEVTEKLQHSGWAVVRVWEHAIKEDVEGEASIIDAFIRSPGGRSHGYKKYRKKRASQHRSGY